MKSTKRLACLVTLLLCGFPFNTAKADTSRTWTDVQGRSINARLLHTDASKTTIEIERADGVRFTLPLARLSFADQQFVQHWVPEPETPGAPATTEAPSATLAELSSANWEWLKQAGSMTARNYVNSPADQLVTLLNARLTGARSANAKDAIKGVRIDADADLTEINMETTATVSLATFFKELAEQNSLQLHVDASVFLVLQRVSTSAPKQTIKFLGL